MDKKDIKYRDFGGLKDLERRTRKRIAAFWNKKKTLERCWP